MTVFTCFSENFHPYECDGPGKCRHCDRREIQGDQGDHDPETCPLCEETAMTSQREDWEMSR